MRFFHRNRRLLSTFALLAFVFGIGASATPASAEYNPRLGRFLQPDPNGTGLVLTQGLRYHGSNPIVTVSLAYELQYGDGMNFYEYLRSNPPNRLDPTGLFVGYQRFVADVTGSAIAAYAFSLDAGIYSLLEEGPEGTGLDRAIESIPFAVAGAFAGGAVAFANRWSPTGNILGGSVAGGFNTLGLGEGFTSGALIGGGVSAAFEAAFRALGRWRTGVVVGAGASAGGIGWTSFLRVLRGRGVLASARQRAIIPAITAAKNVAGRWPAAIAPRSGKVYVHGMHAEAIRLAQEGAVTKAGIRSGEVTLSEFGEVISTHWGKTW